MNEKQEIEITLNGKTAVVDAALTLAEAMAVWGYDEKGVAVALNATFVQRGTYSEQQLNAGDRLEIVSPFAGG